MPELPEITALAERLGERVVGHAFVGAVPLQAIWRVVHTGLPPAAATIFRVTSPTTLRSWFAVRAWTPGGYETG